MDFDPCSVEKPGLLPLEVILALPSPPLQTALALPDPGLAPPEPEGHGYDHGLPPSPPTSASEGEEEDDRGQFKQETVAVKQEVADDFMANLGFGSSTDERALSPDHPILVHDGTGAPSFGPIVTLLKTGQNWTVR